MGYTTTIDGREHTITNISFIKSDGVHSHDSVLFSLEHETDQVSAIFELIGTYGWYPRHAELARDLLNNLTSIPDVAIALRTSHSAERDMVGSEAFVKIGLTEQDFMAFARTVDGIRDSRELHRRLNGHQAWRTR